MNKFWRLISFLLLVLAIVIVVAIICLDAFFSDISMEMIVFNLRLCRYLKIGTSSIVGWGLAVGVFLLALSWFFYRILFHEQNLKFRLLASFLLFVSAVFYFDFKYDFFNYCKQMTTLSNFYEKNYVHPNQEKIVFKQGKKNLIILYLESIENSYMEAEVFGENLMPNIEKFIKKYGALGHYQQVLGTGWTMGGFVSSNCSIPLTADLSFYTQDVNYGAVPGAICLQDILAAHGYELFMLAGTSNDFAGMKEFLNEHGVKPENIFEWQYFKNKYGMSVKGNIWGAKDRVVLKKAQEIILQQKKVNKPFFMTINTVDTHLSKGYVEENCNRLYGDYRDVIRCFDKEIGNFLHWFEKQNLFNDTVLLVIGDHLVMDENIIKKYLNPRDKNREITSFMLGADLKKLNSEQNFCAFDLMPTLLTAIGADWGKSYLGLGRSLFDSRNKNLIDKLGVEKLNDELLYRSKLYENFIRNSD